MFFDETIQVRIRSETVNEIIAILEQDKGEKYENISHFVRCAIIQKLQRNKNG